MLIVNDEQCRRAGVGSLEERCHYCFRALAEYPLILADDAAQPVYHAACAVELATDILVDLFTFLSPPPHMSGSLCSPHLTQLLRSRPLWRAGEQGRSGKEWQMQSTNVRQIKAALVEQAFHGTTQVS